MSIAVRNPVARNIFMAVIYPINQLKIAGVVAMFLLYIFSIIQFFFFHNDFENGECNTLRSCFRATDCTARVVCGAARQTTCVHVLQWVWFMDESFAFPLRRTISWC